MGEIMVMKVFFFFFFKAPKATDPVVQWSMQWPNDFDT